MTPAEYFAKYPSITQDSEKLFVEDFLYPILGDALEQIEPQKIFTDRSGKSRRIDFAFVSGNTKIALEVNGETYHAEGIIPNEMFDDNLYRQNEILNANYALLRFSYTQLQSGQWRPLVSDSLRAFFQRHAPTLLRQGDLTPNDAQREALQALDFYRSQRGWENGVVILPTGTGKTVLSAMDSLRVGGRTLFVVHRLDILAQSIDAFLRIKPTLNVGRLTGDERENLHQSDVLFASKDTLRQPSVLEGFERDEFDYVIIDEVHHGQSPTYREVIEYFKPKFMLGMTATPDRTDRLDILELFDYKKVYELPLSDAISRGLLVPFTYFGLTDDIDYSRIRYSNNRYSVPDLERLLIIPERNEAILRAYREKGGENKAVGFCVSIKHADRMADFFNAQGISAAAIHSASEDRDEKLKSFRENQIQVVFTVDLFNEGIDIPNLRTLLFLRPTESKTVFLQQLGRGLRLCSGKDRVVVLDFIGNYKRANQVRKYLASSTHETESNENGRTRKKMVYTYSTGCEVHFDAAVEEILARQDAEEIEVTREDLREAYAVLVEQLGRKATKTDLDESGEFKSAQYVRDWGSWVSFLRDVGEYTESSYAYPQGVHLGHMLAIMYYFQGNRRKRSAFADDYVALRGDLGEGRLATYRRQVKYKLQAAMEFGIITDDRAYKGDEKNPLVLTPIGEEMFAELEPLLTRLDLRFPRGDDGVPSTAMAEDEDYYNKSLRDYIASRKRAREIIYRSFLRVPAVEQMLRYLYQVNQSSTASKSEVYAQFFHTPFVQRYCEQEGIEPPTLEGAKHRVPFLLNVLASLGIVEETSRSDISIKKLVLTPALVRVSSDDDPPTLSRRIKAIKAGWPADPSKTLPEDMVAIRELLGTKILTTAYPISKIEIFED